jgi:hypothetical protein
MWWWRKFEMQDIKQAVAAGAESEDFQRLLINFGLWSRGLGEPRYVSPSSVGMPSSGPTIAITDESALVIDRCLVRLKAMHELGFWVFKEYYMYRQSCTDIAYQMHCIGRKRHDLVLKNATSKTVKEILTAFVERLYRVLSEGVQ